MKKGLLITAALTAALLTFGAISASADECGQYGQYGKCPPPSTSLMIDKTVGKPASNNTIEYVDNTDYKFASNGLINFQVRIKNISNKVLNNVKVIDYVPSYLEPTEGPGNYDVNSRQITFFIPELKVNEEKTYTIQMQVKSAEVLNTINEGACVPNKASIAADNAYAEDTARFCVEKQVLGVSQVPATGPEHWIAVLIASITSLGIGTALKRQAK